MLKFSKENPQKKSCFLKTIFKSATIALGIFQEKTYYRHEKNTRLSISNVEIVFRLPSWYDKYYFVDCTDAIKEVLL